MRIFSAGKSEAAFVAITVEAVGGHNDMVLDFHVDNFTNGHDASGKRIVLGGRTKIARGMIVNENNA